MNIRQLFLALGHIGAVEIMTARGDFPLLFPVLRDEKITLRVPTHWDVQEAIHGVKTRPENRPWLQLEISRVPGTSLFIVDSNNESSCFLYGEGLGQMASFQVLNLYRGIHSRVLAYCERPGIGLDPMERASFQIITGDILYAI